MDDQVIQRIQDNPKFHELVQKKSSLSWLLTLVILVAYFGLILMIAFEPAVLGAPVSAGGVTTLGIPVGLALIVLAFVLTGIYVRRANTEFDQLNQQLVEDARR
ncbi:uncharacterized membrane protein (DUF485 family) [Silvimonas terrae]|uniref:Uncharacterized membrane protein (DUF485 family) n=1 Tax=Silvimonas terrae TaxID=300266 RepID=A0A840REE2_9NEIS|nr:DUF485 domain-containing protein [Silvimonas terrae]MBB5190786.1 uncharacterized membrane protein (DUF485 family) [Silvimonas terrae]